MRRVRLVEISCDLDRVGDSGTRSWIVDDGECVVWGLSARRGVGGEGSGLSADGNTMGGNVGGIDPDCTVR